MPDYPGYAPLRNDKNHELRDSSESFHDQPDEATHCLGAEGLDFSDETHPKGVLRWLWKNAVPRMNLAGAVLTILLIGASLWGIDFIATAGSNTPRLQAQWSPLYDRLNIPIIEKTLDLFIPWRPEHPENIYSRDPSPETDAAWERIQHAMTFIPLTSEDARRLGKDPETLIKIPEGMRDAGHYLSTQDVLHQVHCLDYLRKGLIHNYHYYWGDKWGFWPPFSMVRHMTHCVDILRQHIMCNADTEVYTYNWRVGERIKWPDFGVKKTCRDFNVLMQHLEETQPADLVEFYRNITKPPNANELLVPLGMWEYVTQETYVNEAGTALNPIPGLANATYCLGG